MPDIEDVEERHVIDEANSVVADVRPLTRESGCLAVRVTWNTSTDSSANRSYLVTWASESCNVRRGYPQCDQHPSLHQITVSSDTNKKVSCCGNNVFT